MMISLPVQVPPIQPQPILSVRLAVRYVLIHRDGNKFRMFDGLFPSGANDGGHWQHGMPSAWEAEIFMPVDPMTAHVVWGVSFQEMGFSDAEQALLNLLKR